MKPKKEKILLTRIDKQMLSDLEYIMKNTGYTFSQIVRASLINTITNYEKNEIRRNSR